MRPDVIENGTIVVDGNRIVAVGPVGGCSVPAGAHAHRRGGQDHHARASSTCTRTSAASRPACWRRPLAVPGQPRLRRDDVARPVQRHRDGLHQQRADPRGLKLGPAPVLDRHHPLRRRDAVQGGGQDYDDALAPPPDEGRGRVQREELQPAAARRPPDDHPAARELEMMVVPEGGSLFYFNMSMINDGTPASSTRSRCRACTATSSRCSPRATSATRRLIVVGYGGLWGENYWYQHTTCSERAPAALGAARRGAAARPPPDHGRDDDWNHITWRRARSRSTTPAVS
jgi:hypothetical protein